MRDQLAGAGEIGLARDRERLERSDYLRARHVVVVQCHAAQARQIAEGRRGILVLGDALEQAGGHLGIAALFGNPRAHHRSDHGGARAILAGEFLQPVEPAVEIARLDLVERTHQRFGIALHLGFLATVPIEIAAESDEAGDQQTEQRLAPGFEERLGIALADGFVDFANQRFLLGIRLPGAFCRRWTASSWVSGPLGRAPSG